MARRFTTRIGAIRANRFADNKTQTPYIIHNVQAFRANRLKPAIRSFSVPQRAIRKKGVQAQEPSSDSRESSDPRESANRFARIGPTKENFWIVWPLLLFLPTRPSRWRFGASGASRACSKEYVNRKAPRSAVKSSMSCLTAYSCGVIIWSKFGGFKCYYLVQVCFFFIKHQLSKNTIKIGVSALFFAKQNCAPKF